MQRDFEILIISHKFPPSIGGMQKQSFELVTHLSRLTKVHTILLKRSSWKPLFFLTVNFHALWICWKNPKIRFIHANDGLMALILSPLLFLSNRKLAVTIHGLDLVSEVFGYQAWVRYFLSRFDLLITVSAEVHHLCSEKGIPSHKIHFIPNGFEPVMESQENEPIDADLENFLSNKRLILSVGRPIERKGFSWFIREVLPQINSPVVYVLVGSGYKSPTVTRAISRWLPDCLSRPLLLSAGASREAEEIANLLSTSECRHHTWLMENLSAQELDTLYRRADLFLMPNRRIGGDFEGFGLVALEAASRGTLPLASRVDGIPSAIQDGGNGVLLPPEDPARWAEKIDELLRDPNALSAKGNACRDFTLKNFQNWETVAKEYLNLFSKYVC